MAVYAVVKVSKGREREREREMERALVTSLIVCCGAARLAGCVY